MMKAKFLGMDGWDRPVYECENGVLVKDTDPRKNNKPKLCTSYNNDFDGEPDTPITWNVELIPQRVVW